MEGSKKWFIIDINLGKEIKSLIYFCIEPNIRKNLAATTVLPCKAINTDKQPHSLWHIDP